VYLVCINIIYNYMHPTVATKHYIILTKQRGITMLIELYISLLFIVYLMEYVMQRHKFCSNKIHF